MEQPAIEQAMAAVNRHVPGVVIADALMPGLDGREPCQNVKAYRRFEADGYLPKPIDFNLRGALVKLGPNAMRREQ